MLDIVEVRFRGQCKYPTTDEPPHVFCGEPTYDAKCPYCAEHAALCYGGPGKDWQALYGMMKATEASVLYMGVHTAAETTPSLDEEIAGHNHTSQERVAVLLSRAKASSIGLRKGGRYGIK